MRALVPPDLMEGYADGWPPTTKVGMFLDKVRQSNTLVTAALTSELDPVQVVAWATKGNDLLARAKGRMVEKIRRPYSAFSIALARAEAEAETAMVAVVREVAAAQGKDSWRAAAWLLDHQQKASPPIPEADDEDDIERLASAVPASGGHAEDYE
jgi:aryl-alcohol dehydrogenase-like predicted oxidoreductase